MKFTGKTGEYFEAQEINDHNCLHLKETQPETLRLLWFTSDHNRIKIDRIPYTFNKNDIVTLTQFHQLEYEHINTVNLLRFNRPFYCILDHDSEVGCKGILYYGAAKLPIISAFGMELEVLQTAWKMASLEFEMEDNLQQEMLQMMLKRILILCARIYKNQPQHEELSKSQHDLVREFNFLVESHFREKHSVAEYADMLYKSPKTITNTFKKIGQKSPLKFIQERILLEARRMIYYTEKDVSEIGYELGFQDIQSFSRFFKNNEGCSPREYRDMVH
ncbi:helix-turn-helix domain-containing protein [Algoriphagus aquimarinus]|uniref:AraC-type DNA-binding protein n=1 Tax=Algoriphagus aquimarinus TaxID=237018 RepID=A0A1I0XAR5_9BACT|nr:AraC family transcriptional regulator [Algoriphagus aquimarinus]SFA98105.1 AraC-type DNA-binding protein [Algoriphagus aquimarinus]|tara:strand:- start:40258 stop:41085 length:828 start_codon:yes stop_codon:yes gene_type:complete